MKEKRNVSCHMRFTEAEIEMLRAEAKSRNLPNKNGSFEESSTTWKMLEMEVE